MRSHRYAEDAGGVVCARAVRGKARARAAVAAVSAPLLVAAGACAAVSASRSSPGTLTGGAFTPARAGAAQYGPDASRTCPAGGVYNALEDDVSRGGAKPQPKGDGRLCAVADTLLGWTQAAPPPESVVNFVAWHFGLPGQTPRVISATVETEDVRTIAERLQEQVNRFAASAVEPRFGLATDRLRKDATRIVLVLQDMPVEIDPLPRRLPANGQATLNGRVLGGLAKPQVLVSNASGKLETTAPASGSSFTVPLRCGERPGRMQVEVRGERNGAAAVLGRFPVTCGAEPPTSVAVAPPEKGPVEAAAKERKLFDLINAERAAGGLQPLAWDDGVASVARAASQSFRDEAKGGGATPLDVVARLKQVDVSSLLVLENPVVAPSAEEAQARLVTSPLHRSNLMHPEATHGGVGVVAGTEGGGSVVYVTELLVRELPPADTETIRAKLRAAIARKRADARAQPLASDPMLEDIAQQYARELAAAKGALAKPRADALVAPLYKSFRSVNVLSGAKAEPLDFAEEPGVAGPGKVMGLGVAQGANPVLGKNAVYVVIFVGARR